MSKGYFYFHNNRPVIAAERRPEPAGFEDDPYLFYLEQVHDWESQVVEAENAVKMKSFMKGEIYSILINEIYWKITPGQAIEYEGNVIHKIIQT